MLKNFTVFVTFKYELDFKNFKLHLVRIFLAQNISYVYVYSEFFSARQKIFVNASLSLACAAFIARKKGTA